MAETYELIESDPGVADCEKLVGSGEREPELHPALARWTAPLLRRVSLKMGERFECRVSQLGLRSKHYGVLLLLKDGPLTQVEIGRWLWIDRTTMVALVDDLVRLALVERGRHPEDRRCHAVSLTEHGRRILDVAEREVDETEAECFAPLTQDERRQLKALLTKLL